MGKLSSARSRSSQITVAPLASVAYNPSTQLSSYTGQKARTISTLNIGPLLRTARNSLQLSLRALAERTEFSASFLSQVELGQSSPSLTSLQRICTALDIELVDLLRDASRPRVAPILRRSEREPLRSEWSRTAAESVLPVGAEDVFRAMLLTLDQNGQTGRIERRQGSREFAYCIRGQVVLLIDSESHVLHEGDSVLLDDVPATAWENTGEEPAEILLVSARLK